MDDRLLAMAESSGGRIVAADTIDNPTMGTIFEELIRKFNEALNENPGGHFTPRDVVHLMVDLMLAGDENESAPRRRSAPSTTPAAARAAC